MQFRADFYNFFNHAQFDNPEERNGRGGFDDIVRPPHRRTRSQLSLRLEF